MAKFYHVDRLGVLNEGQVINLQDIEVNEDIGLDSKLSAHGIMYLKHRGLARGIKNGVIEYDQSFINELLFELIRQKDFSNISSRFKAFFAIDNLDDAHLFAKNPNASIWEVECYTFNKYDMNLLNIKQGRIEEIFYLANKYWKQEASENPFWEYLLIPPVKIIKKVEIE